MSNINLEDRYFGHLIQEGLHGQISLIGFPHSVGASRDNLYKGQENGPACLRRFLSKIGPVINAEYEISIADLSISDYGNIIIPEQNNKNYEELIQKLKSKVKSVLTKNNIPIVIGGSKDCCYAAASSILELEGRNAVISISAYLDMNVPYDGDKLSVTSAMRKLVDDNSEKMAQTQSKIFFFSAQNQVIPQNQMNYATSLKELVEIIPLHQIRRHQLQQSNSLNEPSTQASQRFVQLLQSLNSYQNIHIQFSLESIHSSYCLGVTRMSSIAGLTGEEAIEMMYFAGLCSNVKGVDFTDFNPSNEDYRTGLLLGNLIYYFSLGYAKRIKQ